MEIGLPDRQQESKIVYKTSPTQTAMLIIIAIATLVSAVVNTFWTYEVLNALQKLSELGN